ncbi:MAG: hypothetical protein COT73_06860 [Bdellovibrio sp. CG10_big_fil_rev_8_21_14_0_10_47_8]|nr:MAG: hypothetical protein COT73_06860 [Bdellovibrio sp. CG10_big_fil_rev_8_21_14_0_10_47_8]
MSAQFAEVGKVPFSEMRKKVWQELSLPVEWVEVTLPLPKKSPCQVVLLGPEQIDELLPQTPRVPSDVIEAGFADCLIRDLKDNKNKESWWLRCYLKPALRILVGERAPHLDTHGVAYVTGVTGLSRMCLVLAAQLGFDRLVLVTKEPEKGQALVDAISKLFFGLQIRVIGFGELTEQPSDGSILMNTMTDEALGEGLAELSYLNYVKREGLVVDLLNEASNSRLLEETKNVQLSVLSGLELWGLRDQLLLKDLLQEKWTIEASEYAKAWLKNEALEPSAPEVEKQTKV